MQPNLTIYLIGRLREKANRFIRRQLAASGLGALSPSHGDIFLALFAHEALTMKELAGIIDRDKSTVTGLVEKLVAMGLVEKAPDDRDGRVVNIRLTPEGRRLKPRFIAISRELIEKVTEHLDPEEQQQLERLLDRVNRRWT